MSFSVAKADAYPRHAYDLVCFFDCLHDMGRPVDAVRYAASAMAEDGTLFLIEPFAGDRVEDNIGPVGRLYYAGSTTMCCAHAISEDGTHVLGAQAGPRQLEEVVKAAGLSFVRKALETPFNLILEARLWLGAYGQACSVAVTCVTAMPRAIAYDLGTSLPNRTIEMIMSTQHFLMADEMGAPAQGAETGAAPSLLIVMAQRARARLAAYICARAIRRAEKELMGLDDRMLRDIGLTRSEIPSAVRAAERHFLIRAQPRQ
jgi:uncharacterized protein YjiS (DUF1127 family)